MHIRPAVQSASDVPRDAGRLGLRHERRDLDAPRRRSQGIAVDHAIAEHHGADAGSTEHQPVDRDTRGLIGVRLDWRPLMKDSIGRFTHARSATMLLPLLWINALPEPARPAISPSTAPR